MGQDARVKYTKMIVQVNFLSLLKEKPINKITVKELCALAEINRATFYKYYLDVFDLMEKLEEEILKELRETVKATTKDGLHKTLLRMLEKMQENGDLYITLFSGNGDAKFPLKVFQMCYAELGGSIGAQYPTLTKTEQAWVYIYTAQGSSGILNYWISDGMTEPPKEVAEFIEKLIESTINHL